MNIGRQIKRLRKEKNITQDILADHLGVSPQSVSKWENGITTPDIGLLPDISVYFGIKIDDLFMIPEKSHYDRIENMLDHERDLSDEDFNYAESFLLERLDTKDSARAYGDLAHLYNHRASSLNETAYEYAKCALDLEPENKSHHIALWDAGHAVCGDDHYDNHFDIIEFYMSFIKKNPQDRRAMITLIENMFADGRYIEAEPYVDKLSEDDYMLGLYKGDIMLARGRKDEALSLWGDTLERHPVWQAFCSRGDRYKKLAMFDQAIEDYEMSMSLQEAPRIVDGLLSLSQIYESQGRYDLAIEARKRQLEILIDDYKINSGEFIDKPKREISRLLGLKF
ncbi:helix-turn-helix domain-containing protein [Acidaminobacter sp. JC074]|uniref:helix-turn-helix domain-containing protein n=1 Tax=Acidaminobacter sp. JC074 TaxID=2530199 RepID=UPI001F0D8ACD|nr:helix-turn-helix domain-containing protein [Acidaminobacter sp. JC074]